MKLVMEDFKFYVVLSITNFDNKCRTRLNCNTKNILIQLSILSIHDFNYFKTNILSIASYIIHTESRSVTLNLKYIFKIAN